jgi:hypothetical protein
MRKSPVTCHLSPAPGLRSYVLGLTTVLLIGFSPSVFAQDEKLVSFERRDTSFYSTFFRDEVYNPFLGVLEPLRLTRKLTCTKPSALDINHYDEVIDNTFFTNRHGKKPLSISELVSAPLRAQDPGPDPSGPWTILKGKTEGVTPGFFIRDSKGDKFLLKIDPRENPEMTTSAEVIAHKFFYAFGYNVPSYSLVTFSPDILEADPQATYYDTDGFKRPLTKEKALEMLREHAPLFAGGKYRASASRILGGTLVGYFEYDEKNPNEPANGDLIPHDRLRAIRALRVFGSWLNNYDLQRKNTMAVLTTEDGKPVTRHYLLDFGSSLGSAAFRPKVPVIGFENMVDSREILKAIGLFKIIYKPWERRWDENRKTITHPNLGYFDNNEFNPGTWKSNLPHFAFGYMSAADGYWAAKIISKFTDEEIEALVKTGEISDKAAEKLLTQILIERRDLVVQYWFEKVSPLENFEISETSGGLQIRFDDLGVQKGRTSNHSYRYKAYSLTGKKRKFLEKNSSETASLTLSGGTGEKVLLEIRALEGTKKKPPVKVTFEAQSPHKILSIEH